METMVLKYDYQTEDGSWACKEFEYVPYPDEIVAFLFTDPRKKGYNPGYLYGYQAALDNMVNKFYDEIFHALKNDEKFIKFITKSHTPEEFEDETL